MTLRRFLAVLEVKLVLKFMKFLSEGCYYLKYAEIEDFVKYLKDAEVEEDSDGLTYLKTVRGFYGSKFVELNFWSCGISIIRNWIRWE